MLAPDTDYCPSLLTWGCPKNGSHFRDVMTCTKMVQMLIRKRISWMYQNTPFANSAIFKRKFWPLKHFWDTLNRVGDCCIMTLQSGHQLSDSHCSVKHESNNIKFVQWPNICRGLYLSAATFNPLLLWEKLGTPSGLTLGLRHLLASCIWPQESGQENCSNSLRPRRMKWPRKINQESSFDWNTDHKW